MSTADCPWGIRSSMGYPGRGACEANIFQHTGLRLPDRGEEPLEAILAALSGVPVPYGSADGATGSYL
jgi:hypothetical protein